LLIFNLGHIEKHHFNNKPYNSNNELTRDICVLDIWYQSLELVFFLPLAPGTDIHCRGRICPYFCSTQLILMFEGDMHYKE
jgi:hypothetical protein